MVIQPIMPDANSWITGRTAIMRCYEHLPSTYLSILPSSSFSVAA